MLPAIASSIVLLLMAVLASATSFFSNPNHVLRLQSKEAAQKVVHSAVEQYYQENKSLPQSLSEMAVTPSLASQRQFTSRDDSTAPGGVVGPSPKVHVVRSNVVTLNDGTPYQRVAVIAFKDGSLSLTDFLDASHNTCPAADGGGFSDGANWCGDSRYAFWSVVTDLATPLTPLSKAYFLQQLTADKFIVRFKALWAVSASYYNFAFPAAATAVELRSVVTALTGSQVGTSAADCKGLFHWTTTPASRQGLPLTCSDLYNIYGGAVKYRKIAQKEFELTSTTPLLAADKVSNLVLTTKVVMP